MLRSISRAFLKYCFTSLRPLENKIEAAFTNSAVHAAEQLSLDLLVEPLSLPKNPSQTDLTRFSQLILSQAGAKPDLVQRVVVRWNRRLTSTAGLAYPSQYRVALNPILKELPAELDRTLRHELAHLLARYRAGRKRISPHGPEWKTACRDLGIPGELRCHSLPLPRRRVTTRFHYSCPKCGTVIDRVRPLRLASACRRCCKEFNRGRFSDAFQFVPVNS
jgi:SprT protein